MAEKPRKPSVRSSYYRLLRNHFPSFLAKVFATVNPGQRYLSNWHIELIADYLAAAERGEVRRLVINMPPRALKSVCVSVAWPAWLLGRNPAARIMCASYAEKLSVKHSLDTRLVLQSRWYRTLFPRTRMAPDQNEKHKFATTQRGYRIATSVGGTLTGEGGNFLIVDDPLNAIDALQHSARAEANAWFDHSLSTRLDDKHKGVIVVVMQRLHQEDLSGHLLEKGGWEHLCLPAMAERRTVHQFPGGRKVMRQEGAILHPEREGAAELERMKRDLGSRGFAAQYQQNPVPAEGAMIRASWLRYGKAPIEGRIVQSWDTAIKAGEGHDKSVCLTFLEHEGAHYLLDVLRESMDYPDLKRAVADRAARFAPQAVLIEDKASGQMLLQDLKRETQIPVISIQPKGDKVTRLAAISPMLEAGKLVLPNKELWISAFEQEILAFPNGAHDDQVDALSQYFQWVRGGLHFNPQMRTI